MEQIGTFLAIIFVLILFGHQVSQAGSLGKDIDKTDCNNYLEKIDSCGLASSYSFIYDDYAYPINESKLKKSCAVSQEGLTCLRRYAKCFDPMVKQGLIGFTKGRKSRLNAICKNTNSKQAHKTLDAFKCMYDHKKALFTNGETLLLKRLDAISSDNNLVFDQRLQLACCTIFDYRRRFLEDLSPQCNKYADEIDNEVKSLIGEIVPMMCTKYNNQEGGSSPNKACSNLPELNYPKHSKARSLTRTILEIVVLVGKDDTKQ